MDLHAEFTQEKTKHTNRLFWTSMTLLWHVPELPPCLLSVLQLWARSWWLTCWYETSWGRSKTPCCWMFRTWPKTRTCSGRSAPKVWLRLVWDHNGLRVQLGQGDGWQWRLNDHISRKITHQSPRMTLTLRPMIKKKSSWFRNMIFSLVQFRRRTRKPVEPQRQFGS